MKSCYEFERSSVTILIIVDATSEPIRSSKDFVYPFVPRSTSPDSLVNPQAASLDARAVMNENIEESAPSSDAYWINFRLKCRWSRECELHFSKRVAQAHYSDIVKLKRVIMQER